MDEITMSILTAILGFIGGLLTPWVRWEIYKRKLVRQEKAALIMDWRRQLRHFDFENDAVGDTAWYSSLRGHMTPEVIAKIEAKRTFCVSGGRGENVIKHMLLDEISRLERRLWRE